MHQPEGCDPGHGDHGGQPAAVRQGQRRRLLEAPEPAEQDWDALEGAPIAPDGVPEDVEGRPDTGQDEELPEEDDDNPDQESDEALPDDEEERAIRRDMGGLGTRYEPE